MHFALALALTACAARTPKTPLTAESPAHARPFVPPFAYEAYVRGELLLAQGDTRGAILQFEMATAAPDEDAYLLSRLAEAQAQAGDRALSDFTLREAERLDPCQQSIWLTRGRWAEHDGDLDAAERAYTRAVSCDEGADGALLSLHRVLSLKGEPERGLLWLARASAHGTGPAARRAFARALRGASPAETRFALDTWLSVGPIDRQVMQEAVSAALAGEGTLALALTELSLPGMEPATRAQLAVSARDVDTVRALLARYHESELGGPEHAARLALFANDPEKAELYASLAFEREPSDEVRAVRAEALSALGEHERALADVRGIAARALRQALARDAVRALGMPGLADELQAAQ